MCSNFFAAISSNFCTTSFSAADIFLCSDVFLFQFISTVLVLDFPLFLLCEVIFALSGLLLWQAIRSTNGGGDDMVCK